jgi:hypothetical protein
LEAYTGDDDNGVIDAIIIPPFLYGTGSLGTGILKSTTGSGQHTIATGADLPAMTASVGGAVPTPPNNTTTFLRGDGTFQVPPGGGGTASSALPAVIMFSRSLFGTTAEVPFSSDDADYIMPWSSPAFWCADMRSGGNWSTRAITSDDATSDGMLGIAKVGNYVYVLDYNHNADPYIKIWRYAANAINSGGTLMTFSGTDIGGNNAASSVTSLCSDGTNLYVNNTGGDTGTTKHVWRKYSISGTVLTFVADITCGATSANFSTNAIDGSGNFYGCDNSSYIFRRYSSSGVLAATISNNWGASTAVMVTFKGIVYVIQDFGTNNACQYFKLPLQP